MSTDYQVLLQKFNNFKKFVKQVSTKTEVINDYEKMTDNEFILFGVGFLVPNKDKLDLITDKVYEKLALTDEAHKEKIKRYLTCFIEYLNQINDPNIFTQTVKNIQQEQKSE